jgi:hypothetical protein
MKSKELIAQSSQLKACRKARLARKGKGDGRGETYHG